MKSVYASKVELLSSGQIAVTPVVASKDYQYVYRAAMCVEWKDNEQRFLSPSDYNLSTANQWSPVQWFAQLAAALSSEFGLILHTSEKTAWVAVPADFQADIERAHGAQPAVQRDGPASGGSAR